MITRSFFTNEPVVERKRITKILGIQWDKELDQFIFDLKDVINEAIKIEVVTKCGVLKVVGSIYDPLGILLSFVINLKLLFQEVCALKCGWDITLPDEFCRKWKKNIIVTERHGFNYTTEILLFETFYLVLAMLV